MIRVKKPPFRDFELAVHPRDKVTKTRSAWWRRYDELKAHIDEHGYYKIPGNLQNWMSGNRKKWRDGKLSNEQVLALRKIKFPFNVPERRQTRTGKQKGATLDFTLACKECVDSGKALSNADAERFRRAMNQYRSAYNSGNLSESTARRLGIA